MDTKGGIQMDHLEIVSQHINWFLSHHDRLLVAIDGNCTAGKTTLAMQLGKIYDCNIIHMDDFFLRPEQRTEARYAQPGGNVDYERFKEEVLAPLHKGIAFSYRPFDCKTFKLIESIYVPVKKLNIIEGSYSLHPYFEDPYDLRVLLTVDPQTQHQRILMRPEFLHKRFFDEWIPMENRYFQKFDIAAAADIIL